MASTLGHIADGTMTAVVDVVADAQFVDVAAVDAVVVVGTADDFVTVD